MHQMVAMFYEQRYLDLLDEGHQLDEPLMFTVAKGKPKSVNGSVWAELTRGLSP